MPQPRPRSLTILGIVNVVFGVIMVVAAASFLVLVFGNTDPKLAYWAEREWLSSYTKLTAVVQLPVGVILLVCGIGLLRLRPWGRMLANVYGLCAILTAIGGMIISAVYVAPVWAEFFNTDVESVRWVGLQQRGFAICHGVLLLRYVNRPIAKEAIQAGQTLREGSP